MFNPANTRTPGTLIAAISALPEIQLLGLQLMNTNPATNPFNFGTSDPNRTQIAAAFDEYIDYLHASNNLVTILSTLAPIPLALDCPEFGL